GRRPGLCGAPPPRQRRPRASRPRLMGRSPAVAAPPQRAQAGSVAPPPPHPAARGVPAPLPGRRRKAPRAAALPPHWAVLHRPGSALALSRTTRPRRATAATPDMGASCAFSRGVTRGAEHLQRLLDHQALLPQQRLSKQGRRLLIEL